MISPIDVFCLAVWAGMMALESQRGIIPAVVDFACILVGAILARTGYVLLTDQMRPSAAYLLLMFTAIVLTAILSIYVSRRLRVHVTPVEAAVGAGLGLGSGLLLTYTLFEWLAIRYGAGNAFISDSLLHWAISELSGLHALAEFFRKLTGK